MTRSVLNSKGFEDYLDKVVKAGLDVDEVAGEALSAGAEILREGMDTRVPEATGHLKSKIKVIGPVRNGNQQTVKIGLFNVDKTTEMYFFYQENGSPRNAAHPFIRPAFDEDMKKARAKMKEVFKQRGTL